MTTAYNYTDINVPGSLQTSVAGINNSGEVSGTYFDSRNHGFTELNGTYTTVDYPSPQVNNTIGQKLNNDGDLVGFFSWNNVTYGYLSAPQTGFALGTSSYTIAQGINDSGVIVGFANFGQGHSSGFETISVSATPGASTYTKLDFPNSGQTFAVDINNSGVIVGSYFSLIDNLNHGFEYDGTTWTTLDVPGFLNFTNPQGINDAGDVVGFVTDIQNQYHGFEYSNGVYTITDVPGATNTRFFDINDSGQIVGEASNHHAFVATPGPMVNDVPVTDLNGAGAGNDNTASFTEQTPVLIAPAATVTDVDSATLASLTATLTARPDGDAVESLSLNAAAAALAAANSLAVTYTAATGVPVAQRLGLDRRLPVDPAGHPLQQHQRHPDPDRPQRRRGGQRRHRLLVHRDSDCERDAGERCTDGDQLDADQGLHRGRGERCAGRHRGYRSRHRRYDHGDIDAGGSGGGLADDERRGNLQCRDRRVDDRREPSAGECGAGGGRVHTGHRQ
jgi:probable HAF family extracellular repeat protein